MYDDQTILFCMKEDDEKLVLWNKADSNQKLLYWSILECNFKEEKEQEFHQQHYEHSISDSENSDKQSSLMERQKGIINVDGDESKESHTEFVVDAISQSRAPLKSRRSSSLMSVYKSGRNRRESFVVYSENQTNLHMSNAKSGIKNNTVKEETKQEDDSSETSESESRAMELFQDQFIITSVSETMATLWEQTEDEGFLYRTWVKIFNTEQRVNLWNSLEMPQIYFKAKRISPSYSERIVEYMKSSNKKKNKYDYQDIKELLTNADISLLVEQIWESRNQQYSKPDFRDVRDKTFLFLHLPLKEKIKMCIKQTHLIELKIMLELILKFEKEVDSRMPDLKDLEVVVNGTLDNLIYYKYMKL